MNEIRVLFGVGKERRFGSRHFGERIWRCWGLESVCLGGGEGGANLVWGGRWGNVGVFL